ncbi:MAG: DUF3347 domain-containing protein [Chitinophagaceae bacterium]|nr:MAG: DUF3347 domain-containing protein [Chitinophagaceae bacterium]
MKKLFYSVCLAAIILTACNNKSNSTTENDASKMDQPAITADSGTATSAIKGVVDGYLQLSEALAQDNDKNAADAGKTIVNAMTGLDKSSFTADQAKLYSDIDADAKEHAEHISKNAGNIKHQREHFDMLSKDLYDLVKSVGGGRTLYVANCPMYNKNKGANWLTTSKEIQNPYLGTAMPTCGTIKEELQKNEPQ